MVIHHDKKRVTVIEHGTDKSNHPVISLSGV